MPSTINLTIDGRAVRVPAGTTIMQAAEKIGVRVPRLCYHPLLSIDGACRICVVEVAGMRKLVASCSYPVTEGMVVRTTTPEIRQIRRDICELLLDNHPEDCQCCERDGNCELQRLAYSLGVRERLFPGEKKHFADDYSSPAVVRNPDKCILCHRCVRVCAEVQGVTALGVAHRGFRSNVVPAYELPFDQSVCTGCGQCINVCPTAAFLEHNRTEEVWQALADPNIHTVVHFAPSVRAAIGEGFGLPVGSNLEGQTVAALRLLGFDRVFDTQFGADMCTVEEAAELLARLDGTVEKPLPMLTSCSAAWQKFVEQFWPDHLAHLTTTKSPMSIVSKLVRTYYAEKMGWDPASIFVVTAMCCTAKKWEAARPQLTTNGRPDTDVVITTRELVWMCKAMGINLPALKPEKPDDLLGESTGAAAIYGATGGVMESALRTAYALKFGEAPPAIEFEAVRGMDRVREAVIDFGGQELRVVVGHGLSAAHHIMTEIASGTARFHYAEIMGCPGGCIGGGGQPYAGANSVPLDRELLRKRAEVLYALDRTRDFRLAHENPSVQRLYQEYIGEPLGAKAHALFHTHFDPKAPRGILPPGLLAEPLAVAPPACAGCTDCGAEATWQQLVAAIESNRNAEHPESALIPVLHEAQELFGYLPQHVLDFIAYRVGVPAATVYGVATFYHHFSLTARGAYRLAVCVGTACYVNGSARVLSALEEELGITPGETTADGLFSLAEAHCIGACSLAPAVLINGEVYGNLTPEKAVELISELRMKHA